MSKTILLPDESKKPRVKFKVEIDLDSINEALSTAKWLREHANEISAVTGINTWIYGLCDIIENK